MNSLVSRTMVSGEANASDCQVGNGAEATPEPSSLPRSAIAGADTKDIRLALHKKEVAVEFAAMFLDGYLTPAFGARTKPEIDLLVLGCLIKAKAVDPGAPLYDLARALNITPSKVRALILNWQLRSTEREVDLRQALAAAVVKTRFAKDGALLTFGIENPLLRAEVEARLKRKGVFADASFSREIIRMPVEAFVEFLDDIVEESAKRDLRRRLVEDHQMPDRSFKALVTGLLGKIGEKVAGKAGEAMASELIDPLEKMGFGKASGTLTAFLFHLLRQEGASAVAVLRSAGCAE